MNKQLSLEEQRATADPYLYWREALIGNFGPVHDSDCQAGFWRKRTSRAGPFVPVATWIRDGQMIALVDGHEADPGELWTYICRYPITEDQYHSRVQTGTWHDEDSMVSQSLAPPAADHNHPPQDEAEILAAQIDAASTNAKEYESISDDATAAKAQSARARLLELSGEADKKHKKEKQPFLDSGRAIDKKWFPLRDKAKEVADKIKSAMEAHVDRQRKAADEARAQAEAVRRKEETEARKTTEMSGAATTAPASAAPPPISESVSQVRGAYGKAASIKSVKTITAITDYDALYQQFRDNMDLQGLLWKLAQRAVDAGASVQGVTIEDRAKIR